MAYQAGRLHGCGIEFGALSLAILCLMDVGLGSPSFLGNQIGEVGEVGLGACGDVASAKVFPK